jgi:hypothetical protein
MRQRNIVLLIGLCIIATLFHLDMGYDQSGAESAYEVAVWFGVMCQGIILGAIVGTVILLIKEWGE